MATVTYKCPNCGGGLLFDPGKQNFHCEYCMSYFTQKELEQAAAAQSAAQAAAGRPQAPEKEQRTASRPPIGEAVVYACPSCGAEVIAEETTASTFCYYCHNPVVLSGKLEGKLKPDAVLPFAIEKEEAVGRFREWIGKKKFVSPGFFSEEQIEKLSGVYFPYWITDSTVHGYIHATGETRRVWRQGNTEYTERSYYDVSREGRADFKDMAFNALSKINRQLVEGVQPFDDSKLQKFDMPYLLGFQAEKRDMEKDAFERQASEAVREYTKTLLQETISGYSNLSVDPLGVRSMESRWKYALMPVWVLTYRDHKGNPFYYAMNGQTGKVCGKLPVDKKRLLALFLGISIPLFIILFLGGIFL